MNIMSPLWCYASLSDESSPANTFHVSQKVMTRVLNLVPKEVYRSSLSRAVFDVAIVLAFWINSELIFIWGTCIVYPIGLILKGCAFCKMFNIAHDCSHGVWTQNSTLDSIFGELCCLPLFLPFQSFSHSHKNTTHMRKKQFSRKTISKSSIRYRTHSMSLLASIGIFAYVRRFYDASKYPLNNRNIVRTSIALSLLFIICYFPSLIWYHGIFAPLYFWFIPLCLYKDAIFPYWTRWYRRGIHIHFPIDVSTKIPSYHLRWFSGIIKNELSKTENVKSKTKKLSKSIKCQTSTQTQVQRSNVFWSQSWYKRINWLNVLILFGNPLITIYGLVNYYERITGKVIGLMIFYYFFTGLGITAGYHRYWSHRCFQASLLVRLLLLCGGSGALEGSIKWWCSGHRIHHRYTDTKFDPYNVKKGFFWAHMGWMLQLPDPAYRIRVDISDLTSSSLVRFQHKHYLWIGPLWAYVIPTFLGWLICGDCAVGYFFIGALRLQFVHHSTFCVNSVAHYMGEQTYDDAVTPRFRYHCVIDVRRRLPQLPP